MRDSNRKVIFMLWAVIAVLIIGGGIIGFMLMHKADDLDQTNSSLNGDVDSLQRQVKELRAAMAASPSPAPTASPSVVPTSTPTATPTPAPTHTPAKTVSPK